MEIFQHEMGATQKKCNIKCAQHEAKQKKVQHEKESNMEKSSTKNECNRKKVQHEKDAAGKMVQHEKSTRCKRYNTEKLQPEKSVTRKKMQHVKTAHAKLQHEKSLTCLMQLDKVALKCKCNKKEYNKAKQKRL